LFGGAGNEMNGFKYRTCFGDMDIACATSLDQKHSLTVASDEFMQMSEAAYAVVMPTKCEHLKKLSIVS
jgi:hypothetical protein